MAESSELVTVATGLVFVVLAVVYLYGEIRAIRTDHRSFAVDPDEPAEMGVVRRGLAWVLIVLGLTAGPFLLYVGLAV